MLDFGHGRPSFVRYTMTGVFIFGLALLLRHKTGLGVIVYSHPSLGTDRTCARCNEQDRFQRLRVNAALVPLVDG